MKTVSKSELESAIADALQTLREESLDGRPCGRHTIRLDLTTGEVRYAYDEAETRAGDPEETGEIEVIFQQRAEREDGTKYDAARVEATDVDPEWIAEALRNAIEVIESIELWDLFYTDEWGNRQSATERDGTDLYTSREEAQAVCDELNVTQASNGNDAGYYVEQVGVTIDD